MALSRELSIKNQWCISTSMVLFHKYMATSNLPLMLKTQFTSGSKIFDIASSKPCFSNSSSQFCCSSIFKDIEICYLSCFFLSTKLCNCLTSVSRIAQYFFNLILSQNKDMIDKIDCDCIYKYYNEHQNSLETFNLKSNNKKILNLALKNDWRSRKNSKEFSTATSNNNCMNMKNTEFKANYTKNPNLKMKNIISNSNSTNTITNEKENFQSMNIKFGTINSFSLNFMNKKTNKQSEDTELMLKETLDTSEFSRQEEVKPEFTSEQKYEILRKILEDKIKEKELLILKIIGFDLNIDLPYIFIERMKSYFQQNFSKSEKLIEVCFNFLNDSFKLPCCIYYSPLKIALACVLLLNIHFKVELIDSKNGVKWFHQLSNEIELEEIESISETLNLLYAYSKEKKESNKNSKVIRVGEIHRCLKEIINESESAVEEKEKLEVHHNKDFLSFKFLGRKIDYKESSRNMGFMLGNSKLDFYY